MSGTVVLPRGASAIKRSEGNGSAAEAVEILETHILML